MKKHAAMAMAAALVLAGAVLAGCGPSAPAPDAGRTDAAAPGRAAEAATYRADIEAGRKAREAELRDPDGWLSFAGSGQVAVGRHTVGSAADSAIVLPAGPARWGTLTLAKGGALRFEADPAAGATLGGKPFASAVLATNAGDGKPTRVQVGDLAFYVVRTGDSHAWRFRDPHAPALAGFKGLDYFAVDPGWRIVADWQPYPQPRHVRLLTSKGTQEDGSVPGEARFERDGRHFRLLPVLQEDPAQPLFFIFADRTSGKETYGGARFLYAAAPAGGKVVLDFNRAQNPPCGLTPHVACPMALPENRLDLAVTAGEKKYAGAH